MSTDQRAILIVDDEPEIRELVARLATRSTDARVLTASDAFEAGAILAGERVDALLTDLRMPGRSGIELIRETRRSSPWTRCALMTGFYEDVIDGVALAELDLVRILRKPFRASDAVDALRALLAPPTAPADGAGVASKA